MINPKASDATTYVGKDKYIYIGLEADGTKSLAHSFKCNEEKVLPKQDYYSAQQLLEFGCKKYLYDDPE